MDETLQNNLETIAANQAAIYNKGVSDGEQKVIDLAIDDTLSNEGLAADAKATGDAIHNLAIKNKSNGTLLTLPDSAEQPFKSMKVFGKTKQFSTTGKNKLSYPYNLSSLVTAGVKFTDNGDGTITANGTTTAAAHLQLSKSVVFESGKTYKFVSGTSQAGTLITYKDNGSTKYNITGLITWQDTYELVSAGIKYESGLTINETIYPIIVEGDTYDGIWEPYTGGIPSPNPNYPQALESVGDSGSVEQVVYGKNLLPYPYAESTKTTNGVTFTDNGDGTVTANGTATGNAYFSFSELNSKKVFTGKAGEQYVLCGCPDGGSLSTYMVYANAMGAQDFGNGAISTIFVEDKSVNVDICIYKGVTVSNLTFKPMICLASITDDTYEPYNSQSLTIPTPNGLPGVPVSSGGNYTDENGQQFVCDYKDYERGVYVQRICKYVVTGDEPSLALCGAGWQSDEKITILIRRYDCINQAAGIQNCFSSHHIPGKWIWGANGVLNNIGVSVDGIIMSFSYAQLGLTGDETDAEKVQAVRVFCRSENANGNPITVLFPIEPIETPLSEEEIEAYKALHTNYPVTTIYNNDGAGTEVEYVADTKNYVDNKIATEVAKLTAAIITE